MSNTLNLGNNESLSRGVFLQADGRYLALTFSHAKTFKTEEGARRWLVARGGS